MIIEMIQEWFKELLIDGIISNLSGTFDTVNTKVGEIAGEVGMTPAGWNGGIFNMIRGLSETVIVPIAGIILTFVMCYELIQLIVEKNNLHDFDTWLFWKWIFKTFCAVLIVTNTWNIVMAVFDMAQSVVNQSAGVIISDAGIDISGVVGNLETALADWSIGSLLGLWFQSIFVGLCSHILTIAIFLVIYGRMIEVYLTVSVGPIPFATMANREWGQTGQNYLKSLLALGFQAFLIMVCVGIYAVLVQNIAVGDDITVAIWECLGYTVLLCYTLFRTGSLAKSLFGAHGREAAMKKYKVSYADPPWAYKVWSKKGAGRSAESHYPTMDIEAIKALPVGELADKDCALFLWITFPMLREAWGVMDAWGFTFKTVAFVWIKQCRKSEGLFTGMGYWTRANAEICLLATRGRPKRAARDVKQVILSHVERHSQKPEEARRRIEALMGDVPRIELFARASPPGWDVWGNEVASDIRLAERM